MIGKHSWPNPLPRGGCMVIIGAVITILSALGIFGASSAHASPFIPGCSGGDNLVVSNYNSGWAWYDSAPIGSPPNTFILVGDTTNLYCAKAISGSSWQLIEDVHTGKCLGVDGTAGLWLKTCDPTRLFDQWFSLGPITALLIQNAWINNSGDFHCQPNYAAVISSSTTLNALAQMRCPDNGSYYSNEQTWHWYLQAHAVSAMRQHRHCITELVHYTGTVGHPGYWRKVRFCTDTKLHHHFVPIG